MLEVGLLCFKGGKYFPELFTRRELHCNQSGTGTTQLRCSTSTDTYYVETVNSPTLEFSGLAGSCKNILGNSFKLGSILNIRKAYSLL